MKKMAYLLSLTCLVLLVLSLSFRERHAAVNAINPLQSLQNFVVYYSVVTPVEVHRITAYDMAILSAGGIRPEMMEQLKASGTLLYSYVSLVSVEKTDALKTALMQEDDFLYLTGEKVYNETYDCFQGDILSENYRAILMRIIEEREIRPGFDGVFFDTLDEIEYLQDPDIKQDQFDGYLAFYKDLKTRYPHLSIIQNRGFSFYLQGSSRYLDGLVYEDLHYHRTRSLPEEEAIYRQLMAAARQAGHVILAISHENREENYQFCLEHRWLYYYSSYENNYLALEEAIDSVNLQEDTHRK